MGMAGAPTTPAMGVAGRPSVCPREICLAAWPNSTCLHAREGSATGHQEDQALPEGRLIVRRLAALVAAALLVSAVLPGSLAAADPKGTKLSKEAHVQLAKAAANGDKTITVLIAARPGSNSTVAAGITSLGGKVQYRDDQLDYIRATVPAGKVEAAAALKGVQGFEVDAVHPDPDPRPDGATVPTPQPPPGAATPRNNPYMPVGDTGAAAFTAAHPRGTAEASRSAFSTRGSRSTTRRSRRPPSERRRSSTG